MKLTLLILFFCMTNIGLSQPTKLFAHHSINDDSLGVIDYHITLKKNKKIKPLLIWCDGSGCDPIITIYEPSPGKLKYKISIFMKIDSTILSDYHLVVISKPGVPFSKTIKGTNANQSSDDSPEFVCDEVYHNRLSLEWRAKAVIRVIEDIRSNKGIKINNKKIIVAGHSEGANVAAKAGTLDNCITHVGCFSSAGMVQYFDFVLEQRKSALTGTIDSDTAQKNIEELLIQIKEIYKEPNATNKFWQGHSFKRWSSFTAEPINELLLSLKCKIYVTNSSADKNTMGETMDILPILFIQNNNTNLTFKTCIDCDHWYNKLEGDKVISYRDKVFNDFFDWLK